MLYVQEAAQRVGILQETTVAEHVNSWHHTRGERCVKM
jgi:hypothetical protein